MNRHIETILSELERAFTGVAEEAIQNLVKTILEAEHVFLCGVGRVLLSLQAFEKRLNHLGVMAWHVGEVNEPALTTNDLLILGSGSGESLFPVSVAQKAKGIGAKIAYIGSNPASTIASLADVYVSIPAPTKLHLEGEIQSRQIMSSLFEQCLYLLGDAVSMEIARRKGISDINELWRHHANLE